MSQGDRQTLFSRSDNAPTTISVVGVLLFLAFVVEWVAFAGVEAESLFTDDFLLSFLLAAVFSATIVYVGQYIERSDLSPDRYPRIGTWFVGGIAVFFAINAPMIVVWYPGTLHSAIGWARIAVAMGGVGGLFFGIVEARSIQREIAAERAAVRAEEAETQRQWFDYLNGLLRHEVLNTANVITSYASLHLDDEELDDDLRRDLERIHHQGENMAEVIQDVKFLLHATQENVSLEAVNLSEVLADEVDDLRTATEGVEVTTSIPDGVYVAADDLLPRVFGNLLTNAVQHNDSETPRVDVTVEVGTDTVAVSIADNGPGIPAEERDTLFERSDNTGGSHELGLYLVRTLVERYDGTVRLSETGADGSVFTVELPCTDSETVDSSSVSPRRPPQVA